MINFGRGARANVRAVLFRRPVTTMNSTNFEVVKASDLRRIRSHCWSRQKADIPTGYTDRMAATVQFTQESDGGMGCIASRQTDWRGNGDASPYDHPAEFTAWRSSRAGRFG